MLKGKPHGFQIEVRLGLALIILVLVILNFASHYALFRIKQSLEDQLKNELTEAAVVVSDFISRYKTTALPDSAISRITSEYSLDKVAIIPLTYDRVIALNSGKEPDSTILGIDNSITTDKLLPILHNRPVFSHRRGFSQSSLLFPVEFAGSKYMIAATRQSAILSSAENAGAILIFFGLLGIGIIVYVAARFAHFITIPFERLRDKAVQSGRMDASSGDQVASLINSYEKIIDDLKQKEAELMRLNELTTRRAEDLEVYNNYILKSISTGIITLDRENKLSSINHAAAGILEIQSEQAAGHDYLTALKNYPGLCRLIEDFWDRHRPINNREMTIKMGDRNSRALVVSISPLVNSRGEKIGLSLILNDQTEFLKMQEELELNKRMASLGEMSAGLAHQLRNSTAAMVGLAKLIQKRVPNEGNAHENMRLLLKEALDASALVGRFLDFARPLSLELDNIDFSAMMKEIAAVAREKHHDLDVNYEDSFPDMVEISADSLLLKQAIGNIVDNACQAAGIGGKRIEIKCRIVGGRAEAIITDNGPGIPENIRENIFTPFFSGSPSGSGLGLPLARKIIILHGGHLKFDSRVGSGTTFAISIPVGSSPIMAETGGKSALIRS